MGVQVPNNGNHQLVKGLTQPCSWDYSKTGGSWERANHGEPILKTSKYTKKSRNEILQYLIYLYTSVSYKYWLGTSSFALSALLYLPCFGSSGFAYALTFMPCRSDETHFSHHCLKVFPASGFITIQQGNDTRHAGLIQPTIQRSIDFPKILDSYQLRNLHSRLYWHSNSPFPNSMAYQRFTTGCLYNSMIVRSC